MKNIILLLIFTAFCSAQNPKLCINCKYFMDNAVLQIHGKCLLFPFENNERLVVGDTASKNYYYCTTARSHSDMCGEEAKLFVNKNKKTKVKKLETENSE
jgi:hypothetical protein